MKSPIISVQFFRIAAIATLVAAASPIVSAKETALHFLDAGQPRAATVLAPPPLAGSAEQAADLETVRAVYHAASDLDKNAAYSEKDFSVFNFTSAVGPFFTATNLPKTAAFFEKVQLDADTVTDLGKQDFHRSRPFTVDTNLANGKLEKSFGYPSGHSTESMALALVLADMMPDKSDAILAHARLMGWHRVQIARHYPTDIYAGRVLAQAIARDFKKNDVFEREFAEAKAEIQRAAALFRN